MSVNVIIFVMPREYHESGEERERDGGEGGGKKERKQFVSWTVIATGGHLIPGSRKFVWDTYEYIVSPY